MKHLWLSLMFLLTCMSLHAQEISASVISSGGGFGNNDSGMLSYTVSEMTAVTTLASPASFLTQGFQQPWDLKTDIINIQGSSLSVAVYPNPSNGSFTVHTITDEKRPLTLHITSLLGMEVHAVEFFQETEEHVEYISLSDLPAGMYVITIRDQSGVVSLAKIQIIR